MFVPTAAPGEPGATTPPTAVAVILGSRRLHVWVAGRGSLSCPTHDAAGSARAPVRRGRVADKAACIDVLSQLVRQYRDPVPAGCIVVVGQPVLATTAEQDAIRKVVEAVFRSSRVRFIDTVRAAAIGAGAAAGSLLIADIGAELSEVAALQHGRVAAARRTDIGTRDLTHGAPTEVVARATTRMIDELRHDPAARAVVAAGLPRGLLTVGDGAMTPSLTMHIATSLRMPVRSATAPWTAALNGAGLAAMSATRHPSAR